MNEPGFVNDLNWRWRLVPEAIDEKLTQHIRELTARYGRLPESDDPEMEPIRGITE